MQISWVADLQSAPICNSQKLLLIDLFINRCYTTFLLLINHWVHLRVVNDVDVVELGLRSLWTLSHDRLRLGLWHVLDRGTRCDVCHCEGEIVTVGNILLLRAVSVDSLYDWMLAKRGMSLLILIVDSIRQLVCLNFIFMLSAILTIGPNYYRRVVLLRRDLLFTARICQSGWARSAVLHLYLSINIIYTLFSALRN